MPARLRLLLFALLLTGAAARAADVSPAEKLATAQRVHDIFEAKCLDCHGPELARPKGKFGYVLDLARVAENPDYVIRLKPADSEIYKMVLHDEMPGEDANVPPLTPEEKDVVKHWIELGAPGELPEKADRPTVAQTSLDSAKPRQPLWQRALRWIGQMHPVSTHFPIALMMVAVFVEGLSWWTRKDSWLQTIRLLVILAALGAVGATALGWVNAYFSSYNKAVGSVLWWHRWVGSATTLWALVCAGLVICTECAAGTSERQRLRGALIAGAALIGITGFLGSALIYGLDHYAWK